MECGSSTFDMSRKLRRCPYQGRRGSVRSRSLCISSEQMFVAEPAANVRIARSHRPSGVQVLFAFGRGFRASHVRRFCN